jgi:hypothetical protein
MADPIQELRDVLETCGVAGAADPKTQSLFVKDLQALPI